MLAHVPDINDFVARLHGAAQARGVATFEFPHLLQLVAEHQFDTVYHEHYSYLSLNAVQRVFAAQRPAVFDVEELPTHGGSLRVFAQRRDTGAPRHERRRWPPCSTRKSRPACTSAGGLSTASRRAADTVKDDLLPS